MELGLKGIHHLTAVTADVRDNYRFYTGTLGMRLVKRTVNQDDVSAYHLFYADAVGTPGTDLTFFDWDMPPERRGTNSISRTFLRVHDEDAVEWWSRRLKDNDVSTGGLIQRDGRYTLEFEDPEGQRLAIIDDGGTGGGPEPWGASPVPYEYQIRGLGPIMLSVPDLTRTDRVLTEVMNMRSVREYPLSEDGRHIVTVYQMHGEGPHAELHIVVQPDIPPARLGAGGVHHVAFRTPDDEQHDAWTERLNEIRIPNSGKVDRFYFRSLYFREPNGILFEIATDGPGFAVDEDPATLGEEVALPPFLEPSREAIVSRLKPIEA